jgi:hypothetical protein
MALSPNQQQLNNWGGLFDVPFPDRREELPRASLAYWLRANRRAIEIGQRRLGEHFLILSFDRLCDAPGVEVGRLCDFLGLSPGRSLRQDLERQPARPPARRPAEPGVFDEATLREVAEFGF